MAYEYCLEAVWNFDEMIERIENGWNQLSEFEKKFISFVTGGLTWDAIKAGLKKLFSKKTAITVAKTVAKWAIFTGFKYILKIALIVFIL